MKIAFGNDHAAVRQRDMIFRVVQALGHEIIDYGTSSNEAVDYPDIAEQVARMVMEGKAERGILMCGTGIGMAIVANKFPGIRCSVCTDEYGARMARAHNNANLLALRGREFDAAKNEQIVRIWLTTHFEAGRHERRIQKIQILEEKIAREICGSE